MGKRGPPKTPTTLKVIRGTATVNPFEIEPPKPETLEAPDYLNAEAKKVWIELSTKLEKLGLLTSIDLVGFARYCDMIPKWLKAKKTIDEKGFYYPIFHRQTRAEIQARAQPRIKYLVQFPEVAIYTQLGKELSRLEQLFGMNPSSRSSLNIDMSDKQDEAERRLFGK